MPGRRANGKTDGPGGNNKAVASPKRASRLRSSLLAAGIIAVVVSAAYLNSFSGVFLLDDTPHIVGNPQIRRLWPIGDVLAHTQRPMVSLSLAVNYAMSELDVWSYHAFNLLVHLLAVLTLFGVVRRTLLRDRFEAAYVRSAWWLALAVALIWGVHPLQTQSVTYIIQRGESMMGLFYLLTLYCVIRGVDSSRSRWWYAASVVACGLGMGSKAVMLTAPLMVLLYDRVFLARSFGRVLRRRRGLYLGLAATWGVLVALGIVRNVLFPPETVASTVGFSVKGVTALQYALSQPGVILHYLKLSVWPHVLCLDYGWPVATAAREIIPQTIVVALLVAGTLWAFPVRPRLGFAGAWFFLILAPTSSFIPIKDLAFEHRLYLPLAAVVGVTVVGGHGLLCRVFDRMSLPVVSQRGILGTLVAAVVVLSGYGTSQRNRDYHGAVGMWSDVVRKRPQNPRGHGNLSRTLVDAGEFDEALVHGFEALALQPDYAEAHYNLGIALESQGKLDQAISHYRQALRLKPGFAVAHNNLGIALESQGQLDQAISHYRHALQIEPAFAKAHNNLSIALESQGKLGEAITHYRRVLQLWSHRADVHNNLGNALLGRGELDEAVLHYRQALQIQPVFAEAHYNLAITLTTQGKSDEAIRHYRHALQIKPDYAEAHSNLGLALASRGELDQAVTHYRRALEVSPEFAIAHSNLANALAVQGKLDEAISHYRQAVEIKSDFADAHAKLGIAVASRGRFDEAIGHLRRALEIKPGDALAHNELGTILSMTGQAADALAHFREAIRLSPNWAAPLNSVAWILATHPDAGVREPDDAVRLAGRASELTRYRDPAILDTLAAACAATGQFDRALAVAQEAHKVAIATGADELADTIQTHVDLYRQAKPYREPSRPLEESHR